MNIRLFRFLIKIGIPLILYVLLGVFDGFCSENVKFDEDITRTNLLKKKISENVLDNSTHKLVDSIKIVKVTAYSYNLTREQCGSSPNTLASGKFIHNDDVKMDGCDRVLALSLDLEKYLNIPMGKIVHIYGAPEKYNGCYTFNDRMGYKTKNGKIQIKSIDILTKTLSDARSFGRKIIYLVYFDINIFNTLNNSTKNTIKKSISITVASSF